MINKAYTKMLNQALSPWQTFKFHYCTSRLYRNWWQMRILSDKYNQRIALPWQKKHHWTKEKQRREWQHWTPCKFISKASKHSILVPLPSLSIAQVQSYRKEGLTIICKFISKANKHSILVPLPSLRIAHVKSYRKESLTPIHISCMSAAPSCLGLN